MVSRRNDIGTKFPSCFEGEGQPSYINCKNRFAVNSDLFFCQSASQSVSRLVETGLKIKKDFQVVLKMLLVPSNGTLDRRPALVSDRRGGHLHMCF